jgi:hypothetical protein
MFDYWMEIIINSMSEIESEDKFHVASFDTEQLVRMDNIDGVFKEMKKEFRCRQLREMMST